MAEDVDEFLKKTKNFIRGKKYIISPKDKNDNFMDDYIITEKERVVRVNCEWLL